MLEHYELTFIVSGDKYTDDTYLSAVDKIKRILTDSGATFTYEEPLGKRKLAYPINHIRFGYYTVVEFDLDTAKLPAVSDTLRLHEDVVRHLIIKVKPMTTEEHAKQAAMFRKLAQEEEAAQRERMKEKPRGPLPPSKQPAAVPAPGETKTVEKVDVDTAGLEKKLDEILKDSDSII